jgi:hypothetical protein
MGGRFDLVSPTTQTYKIALYNNTATLNASTTQYTTVGEIVASGYTAGGNLITPSVSILDGIAYLSFANTSWNAALTARGALIYRNIASASTPFPAYTAMCVLDFGSDKTSTTTFTVEFPPDTNTSALIRLS